MNEIENFNKLRPVLSVIVSLCLLLSSCDNLFLFEQNKKKENSTGQYELRPLDKLFLNGFQMELEQVYIMNQPNSDNYVDYCFKNGNEVVNLLNYQTTSYTDAFLLYDLSQGDVWKISKMVKIPNNYTIEHGYGSSYFTSEVNDTITKNYWYIKSDITFFVQYIVGDIYTYRHPDDHVFQVNLYNNGTEQATNLVLEVIKEFDGQYLWLQTNNQYSITYSLTAPLTGDQVKNEIAKGNYQLYLFNGLTAYEIGGNLYIPRFNSYVYVGTINSNGMINGYANLYYRLKFKII